MQRFHVTQGVLQASKPFVVTPCPTGLYSTDQPEGAEEQQQTECSRSRSTGTSSCALDNHGPLSLRYAASDHIDTGRGCALPATAAPQPAWRHKHPTSKAALSPQQQLPTPQSGMARPVPMPLAAPRSPCAGRSMRPGHSRPVRATTG